VKSIFLALIFALLIFGSKAIGYSQSNIDRVETENNDTIAWKLDNHRYSIIHIGYAYEPTFRGDFTLGIEHELKRYSSLNFDIGLMPFNPYARNLGRYFGFRSSFEMKYFFAGRKRSLEGFFLGFHVGINRVDQFYIDSRNVAVRASWGQLGATLGFQKHLLGRFNFGVAIEAGYGGKIYYKYFSKAGNPIGLLDGDLPFVGNFIVQIGYKF
jgi:hypothetical protein